MKKTKVFLIILLIFIIVGVIWYVRQPKISDGISGNCFKEIKVVFGDNSENKDICFVKGKGKTCSGSYDCENREVCGYELKEQISQFNETEPDLLSEDFKGQCFVPSKTGSFVGVEENQAKLDYIYVNSAR